ncbi:glycosyltransferase [Pontibacter sp. CAU 1760]
MPPKHTNHNAEDDNHLDVVGSIVAYKSDAALLNKAIASFLDTPLRVHLYLIDNAPTDALRTQIPHDTRITYQLSPRNLGFGSGHNVSMHLGLHRCTYFLVLNPDVYFDPKVVTALFLKMEARQQVVVSAPQVLYPDASHQGSRRLLPSPQDLFLRRVPLLHRFFRKRLQSHQYEGVPEDALVEVPFLLGCFLMIRSQTLRETGPFDERFFLYLEDVDLCRRLSRRGVLLYDGSLRIYHVYQRASAKTLRLFMHHLVSSVKYFNKWGWWQDAERDRINRKALQNKHNLQQFKSAASACLPHHAK